jgi:penicillin-binding protein 2
VERASHADLLGNVETIVRAEAGNAVNSQQRLRVVGVLVVLLILALSGRLLVLQTLESADAQRQAARNIFDTEPLEPTRGRILDRYGRVLVDNLPLNVVRIDRKKLKKADRVRTLSRLSSLLDVPYYLLERRLDDNTGGDFTAREVARGVKETIAVEIAEHAELFPATSVGTAWQRVYPNGTLAAHVLGYVGKVTADELGREPVALGYARADYIGKTGIEKSFERELRGEPGEELITKDRLSRVVDRVVTKEPVPGKDVRLTIDIDTQKLLEETLVQNVKAARQNVDADDPSTFIKATSAAGVVTDPNTGEVLAMASYPTYDPREFVPSISQERFDELFKGEDKRSPLTNRASFGLYPPGSTFKPFTAIAGLRAGLISAQTTIDDQGAFVREDLCKKRIRCRWRNAGEVALGITDLRKAIRQSSDVYFYSIGSNFDALPKATENGIQRLAKEMGLARPTNIRLPDERTGAVPDEAYRKKLTAKYGRKKFPNDSWFTGDTINVSIGQGEVLASPLGLARAYGTLVNGGTVLDSKIDLEIRDRGLTNAGGTKPARTSTTTPATIARAVPVSAPTTAAGPAIPAVPATTTTIRSGVVAPSGAASTLGIPSGSTLPPVVVRPIVENHLDLSEADRAVILAGLEDVTSADGGTARSAFDGFPLDQCRVAGKTGTAQRTGKQDTAVFVGFGPLPAPKYVVAIVIEEGGFGRQAAAGVRRMFEGLCGLPVGPVRTVTGTSKEF